MDDVLAVILGGGRGARLFPLTELRSKPAVPFAGKYRLIDVPVSNCLNSELRRIFVLTQFNSESLNKHLSTTYNFDAFSGGFVSLLAAEQRVDSPEWFQGTADAVRQSFHHLQNHRFDDVIILSGDQLYQMDYRKLVEKHRRERADITVAVQSVSAEQTSGFGILKVNQQGRIVHFEEKPEADRLPDLVSPLEDGGEGYLASLGIYVFTRAALEKFLGDDSLIDFGKHVIPEAVPKLRVQSFVHTGYWEDVGTIRSYYEAHLGLCRPMPAFDLYDAGRPVYTHARFLPATKVEDCRIQASLVSEGCILIGAEIENSVIGIRSRVGRGASVRDSLLIGADYYQTLTEIEADEKQGRPSVGIGEDTEILGAIVDKNARIGRGVEVRNESGAQEADADTHYVRDGIVVIPKNAVVPDGTVI